MLHVLTYAAALGLSVGILMMLASREGGEAFLLTVPLIAITIGLPTAVLFAILLPLLPSVYRLCSDAAGPSTTQPGG